MKKICLVIILLCSLLLQAQNMSTIPRMNSGELSPETQGRIDVQSYYSGLQTQENFLSEVYGGIVKRSGTYYIYEAQEYVPAVDAVYDEGDYTEYYICRAAANYGLVKILVEDDSVDTSWGNSGYWGSADAATVYRALSLDDGRMLVSHTGFEDGDGDTVALAMLDSDGAVDTTWGKNGYYVTDDGVDDYHWGDTNGQYQTLFECDDGTFVVVGATYYHKISADGDTLATAASSTYPNRIGIHYLGCADWADDEHDRIIIVGNGYVGAIDPSDLSIDTNWGGLNGANAGFAKIVNASTGTSLQVVSDGFLVSHFKYWSNDAIISKINLAGTALDTTWASSGYYTDSYFYGQGNVAKMEQDSDGNLYYVDTADGSNDHKVIKLDSDGTLLDSQVLFDEVVGANPYYRMFIINDIIYFYTKKTTPAQYYLERWNTDLEYIDGSDAVNLQSGLGYDLVVDEYTRSQDVNTPAVDAYWTSLESDNAVRLIPFEYSKGDAFVLELTDSALRFYQ